MLSLTSAKSGALIGVLISVTTIPAAANIGVAAALGEWERPAAPRSSSGSTWSRSCSRASCTLFLQRRWYVSAAAQAP